MTKLSELLKRSAKKPLMAAGAAVVLTAALLAGCRTAAGGGWIRSATGAGKATFGFRLECDADQGVVDGELQYIDHSAGVSIHGEPTTSGLTIDGRSACGGQSGDYFGDYVPLGGAGSADPDGGVFHVVIQDNGQPGPSPDDRFSIELFGGAYDGYHNAGPLGGGNIQFLD
jgi:hypothetical protein